MGVQSMGTFDCQVWIESADGRQTLELEAMVDTGSTYTMVPARLLHELGVKPIRQVGVVLADGRRARYDIGEARATIDGESVNTLVVFGEDGTRPLLGAYTLEGLGLAADPVHGRLVPMPNAWA